MKYLFDTSRLQNLAYWKPLLTELPKPVFTLKSAYNRTGASGQISLDISDELQSKVRQFCKENETSPEYFLMAAFAILIKKTIGHTEQVLGLAIDSLSSGVGAEKAVMPLKVVVPEKINIEDLIRQLIQQQKADQKHYAILLEDAEEGKATEPLFEVCFSHGTTLMQEQSKGTQGSETQLIPLSCCWEEKAAADVKTRLTLYFQEDYLSQQEARLMASRLLYLIQQFAENIKSPITAFNLLSSYEKNQLHEGFNNTKTEYPQDQTVLDFFTKQVEENPNRVALVFEEQVWTYQELDDSANQLAHYLIKKGVKQEDLVALCIERSAEMMIGLLGILKCGAAYIPLDPKYPQSRINYIVEDTNAQVIVSTSAAIGIIENQSTAQLILLDKDLAKIQKESTSQPDIHLSTAMLAYVIYTSGSTGKPKGVMLEHRSLTNFLCSMKDLLEVDRTSSLLAVTTYSFDISYLELYLPLIVGGKVILANRATATDAFKLKEMIAEHVPSHMQATPITWQFLVDAGWSNEEALVILSGGEAIKEALKDRLTALTNQKVWNLYGPTETTIWSTAEELKRNQKITIGHPIANTQIYILNHSDGQTHSEMVPLGGIGELCISGDGLARGYLNRPKLTAEKFMDHPFEQHQGKKIYKTGDLARWLPDGRIECLGRIDDQVKIRGHRIELGEIETILQQDDQVDQCVVVAREDVTGAKALVAYVIAGASYDREEVSHRLKAALPAYMVPSFFITLDAFPQTPNGKIDKKALPNPDSNAFDTTNLVLPRNETEETLAQIWQRLFKLDQIGVNNNFFDLGGHSLMANWVVASVRKELGVELTVKDLFTYPTIASLAGSIQSEDRVVNEIPSIQKQERPIQVPLSYAQERLWFIDRLEGSVHYHLPVLYRVSSGLKVEWLEQAYQTIVNRHESLRTTFAEKDGQPYQVVMPKNKWKLNTLTNKENKAAEEIIEEVVSLPFNLETDHMLRVHLIELSADDFLLIEVIHHIASDGWSRSIIVDELQEIYQAQLENRELSLNELPVQYADYSLWQRAHLQSTVLDQKLDYWDQKLSGLDPLNLPTDFPRPAVQTTHGNTLSFKLDAVLSRQLAGLSRKEEATLFMTLLSAFKVLLHRYSGQTDICVGTGIANRRELEIEGLIGFFVNNLALRSNLEGNPSFLELLAQLKSTTLEAYAHQDAPFEKVVARVERERDPSRSPLFQVVFVLQNTPDVPVLQLGEAELRTFNYKNNTCKHDLIFFLAETEEGIEITIEYNTDLFLPQSINRMMGHYQQLLSAIVSLPQQAINQLSLVTEEEKEVLLQDFNNTHRDFPLDSTLVEQFEQQARLLPNQTAVRLNGESITYQELNEKSNQLARYLRDKGAKEDMLVAICLDRSIEMIVGVLGILKSGAAYVPIDPEYPQDRINFILQDTNASIVISTVNYRSLLNKKGTLETIFIDRNWEAIAKMGHRNLTTELDARNLAYVIYTSGSTGTPKGVMIEHASAVNMALFHQERFKIRPIDRALQFTSLSFDVSVCEIFMTLLSGATLVLLDKELIDAGDRFVAYLKEQQVTVAGIPTAYLNVLDVAELSFLRVLQTGGEVANVDQVVNCARFSDFFNAYGPTECTVCATSYQVKHSDAGKAQIPIGEPAANTSVYILDPHQQLVPINVEGELYIGGAGLARGYLFRKDLTAEKFVAHPFIEGERIYRTGDRARWLADGNIEFIGRMDDQVKIRGFRIELGEIESVINEMDEVMTNCLVVKEDQQSFKNLINYYIPDPVYVKRKEVDFYQQQVNNWQDLNVGDHDSAIEVTDEEFNFTGWIDSFTGDHLSAVHMKEWLDDIIEVISRKESERVLEIGCGSGMIYYRLAPNIKKYIGFDLSQVDIDRIQNRIAQHKKTYPETSLFVGAADQVSLQKDQRVDTVVLNSVIQYFPGEQYLLDIIEKSLAAIEGQGRVVIGDVRNNELQRSFKSRMYLNQFAESGNSKDLFYWNVTQDILNDKELCVAPAFFYALQQQFPEITHVDIEVKDGECVNEMMLYRYNVVLHVRENSEVVEPNWIDSTQANYQKQLLEQIEKGEKIIGIKGLQNPMLRKELKIREALNTKAIKTVKAIAEYTSHEAEENDGLELLRTLANEKGYQLRKLVNADSLKMNVVLERENKAFIRNWFATPDAKEKANLTNSPLFYEVAAYLQKEIRQSLQSKLPEYMTPAKFVPLMEMPLTPNGKVDRKFLSQYESSKNTGEVNYVAPVTPLQKELATIWKELLFVEKVGIYDNFFELGGHSLLATRLASAIKNTFHINVAVKDIFSNNTIAELAKCLGQQEGESQQLEIKSVDRNEALPLSYSQERLWFIDRLEGSSHYHMPAVFRFNGPVDASLLESSIRGVLERHEILRTIYKDQDGLPYQESINDQNWQMKVTDHAPDFNSPAFENWIEEELKIPFDLTQDFMLRACLASQSAEEHILVMTIHHIACDGWSMPILVQEICENYKATIENRPANLEPLQIQYADFASWQRAYLQGELLDSKLTYWEKNLKGLENLNLPTDFQRPVQQSTKGDTLKFNINKNLSAQLKSLAQAEKSTLFMLLLSVYKILLYRYSGQKNICVGSPIANRTMSEVEPLIGFFLNTLALRSDLGGNPSFKEFLGRVKKTTLDAYSNQDVPLEKIVEQVGVDRDMSRSPLFQVLFVLQNNSDIPVQQLGETSFSAEPVSYKVSSFDLTFSATETTNGIELEVEYCTDLFLPTTIERMIEHYMMLLSSVVIDPVQRINKLVMLTSEEVRRLLIDFNKTKKDYPLHRNIPELFEVQARKYPDHTAITFKEESISYRELDEKANQLAHYLRSKGVKEETLVGLYFNRSIEMVIGLLGVLKSGGAYVPIDPDYPRERIDFILKDTNINIVVTQKQLTNAFDKEQNIELVALDGDEWQKGQPQTKPEEWLNARNLAYVIYTSGSTGLPKGAMVEHRSAVNMALYHVDCFGITDRDHVLQFTSLSFDVSFCEIFMTLLAGANLVLIDKSTISDGEEFIHYLEQHEVSVAGLPAAFLNIIELDRLSFLRVIMTGGEVANVSRAAHCASFSEFFNAYGPTECTVCASTYQVLPEDAERNQVPIGKPIANTEIYILDNNMQLLPPFAEGEICIGGVSLARGYLNQDYLTSKKFVPHPFKKGERLYRTGDRGKWLPDGNIDFLGRVDDQVKIRGYRVELGEIEIVLQQSELVSQCVVLAKNDASGNKQLLAYIVPEEGYNKHKILEYLKSMIPDYMVPAIIIEMENLPRNANDKIDKTALPEPSATQLVTTEYVAPRNVVERKLVKIWKQLLPVDRIGVYDNFFELGGHSLLATRVGAMIRKQFHKELAIKTLFENPTIASLANAIKRSTTPSEVPALTIQEKGKQIPLSFSQERLWFTNQLEGSVHYHMPMLFRLTGEIDASHLELAFRSILQKHEVLRSVYAEEKGRAYQQLIENREWTLQQSDELLAKEQEEYRSTIIDLVNQPFDLSNDFMLRAHLLPVNEQENLLLIVTHHIASDGWSMSIFINELIEAYQAQLENRTTKAADKLLQYADYAIWQKNHLSGEVLENKLQYWEQKLQGVEPLNMPTDFTRPAIQSTNGDIQHFEIDAAFTSQLRALAKEEGVTLFMLLLTAFKVLLHRYTGQTDICVGSTIANRTQTEVESLIGFFVNTIALRSDLGNNPKFNELLKAIKSTTLDAYTHQDVPFEKIVDKVEGSRDLSRSPIFQVMFEAQNTPDVPNLQLGAVQLSPEEFDYKISKFDLTFDLTEAKDLLTFGVEYCTDLFAEDAIQQLFSHYLQLLKSILAAPDQRIEQINMLAKEEAEMLLGAQAMPSGEWFNQGAIELGNEDPINTRFEQIAATAGSQLAIIHGNNCWTYTQLNTLANQVAHTLTDSGVQPQTLVGVYLERTPELVATLLGILKCGAVYVPLDTQNPVDRIQSMIETSEISTLITRDGLLTDLTADSLEQVVLMDDQRTSRITETIVLKTISDLNKASIENPKNQNTVSSWAYMLYTSGSTGQPKGAITRHDGAMNHILAEFEALDLKDGFRFLQSAGIGSDISVWQMLAPVLKSGAVVIVDKLDLLDFDRLLLTLKEMDVSIVEFVPSYIWRLVEHIKGLENFAGLPALEWIMMVGEEVPVKLVNEWRSLFPDVRILNGYGPCEASDDITQYEVIGSIAENAIRVPIGRPIANMNIVILDKNGALCPIGIAGELCVSGVGVGAGYWKMPEKTAERFIANPFKQLLGDTLYRTGDLAKWLPNGNLAFLGRIDRQVKIRGHRVELGEIETFIRESAAVTDVHVMVLKDENQDDLLAAFIVAASVGEKRQNGQLKAFQQALEQAMIQACKSGLPVYMQPARYCFVPEMPQNLSDKVDEGQLLKIFNEYHFDLPTDTAQQECQTPTEERLRQIWSALLNRTQIGRNDDFFELGGHSLLAMRVKAAIAEQLNINVDIKDLFIYKTISELAGQLDNQLDNSQQIPAIQPLAREGRLPLSFGQERLWFVDKFDGSSHYHSPEVYRVKGKLNREHLEYALNEIVNRHEVLRTVYKEEEGNAYQDFLPRDQWKLSFSDLSEETNQQLIQDLIEKEVSQAFDLEKDHMLRAHLLRLSEEEHVFVLVIHHIATDGWSDLVFNTELIELYEAVQENRPPVLDTLPIQYADYAVWQREYLQGEVLKEKLDYWKEQLNGIEALDLPIDFVRPTVQSIKGGSANLKLDQQFSESLEELARKEGVTLYMLLVSVFKVLLNKYSGQNDLCVGTNVANRTQKEIESLVGFFVNSLTLRSYVNESLSFTDFLQQVKETVLDAYSNQEVPFEKVVDYLTTGRDLSRSPLFQVAFDLHSAIDTTAMEFGGLTLDAKSFDYEVSQFDLGVNVGKTKTGLELNIQYCSDLFKKSTAERILRHYKKALESVLASPSQNIDQINILPEAEKQIILGHKCTDEGEWFNEGEVDLGNTQSINERFEEVAAKAGEEVAVICEGKEWTYEQLNTSANQIAHTLKEAGVQQGDFVGVYLDRDPNLIASLLGIIKYGAVYVPLDTQNPVERIESMIESSGMKGIITSRGLLKKLDQVTDRIVLLMDQCNFLLRKKCKKRGLLIKDYNEINKNSSENPENVNNLRSWAYMLFTSGSTGQPKGAITRHDGAMNHILAEYDALELKDGFRFLQSAGIGSDISVWQILAPLLKGGAVVIINKFDLLEYGLLLDRIEQEKVSIVEFVPSFIWGFLDYIKSLDVIPELKALEWIMMVGEAVPVKLVNEWRTCFPNIRILNGYGPCEASDDITQYEIIGYLPKHLPKVPIGRPISNMNIFITDKRGQLCPIGVPGEICVSGVGVGAGYWGLPERTAQSFIDNPFENTLGDCLYKTGDLGRWLADGNLEFLGRIDRQVKIRGHRVELGEIESFLREDEQVKDTHLLISNTTKKGQALISFVVPEKDLKNEEEILIEKSILRQIEEGISKEIDQTPSLSDKHCRLEKGIQLFEQNRSETLFAYEEIFSDLAYMQHGINLKPGAVVIDVGANIGIFSMFISLHYPGSQIYAFEPLPPTFEVMQANSNVYSIYSNIKAYNAGLSNKRQEVTFQHYPQNTMLSGRYGDHELDSDYVRKVLEKQIEGDQDQSEKNIDWLVEKAMEMEEYKCQLLTLSEVIKENNIERIDLLKIDAERSEIDVIEGIEENDWAKIQQLVIEVHEDGESVSMIKHLLDQKGFDCYVEQEDILKGTDLYNIYAKRKDLNGLYSKTTPRLVGLDELQESLRAKCSQGLPAYMQPTYYCMIEEMPYNLSDKVDEKALLRLFEREDEESVEEKKEVVLPDNDVEAAIYEIWLELLDLSTVGVHDDFFVAGGHSLKVVQLVSAIYKKLNCKLTIQEVFSHPTIAALAQLCQRRETTVYQAIPKVATQSYYPTSNAQKRLWILSRIDDELIAYNTFGAMKVKGNFRPDWFEMAVEKVVDRHEILRTTFIEIDGVPMQKVNAREAFGSLLETIDYTDGRVEEAELREELKAKGETILDLEKGPLFQATLYQLPDNTYYIFILMHHIVCDGWSNNIFWDEVLGFYSRLEKEGKTTFEDALEVQYKDFAAWQLAKAEESAFEAHRQYWLDTFSGDIPALNFPAYKERPTAQTYNGQTIDHKYPVKITEHLKELGDRAGASLFMTLTAALKVLLYKYTGQEDFVFGVASSGRIHPDLENQIGYYINTVPLRNQLDTQSPFNEFLKRVKTNTLESFAHEEYPYDLLIKDLDYNRDLSRNPLFDVLITLQNLDQDELSLASGHLDQMQVEPVELEGTISLFDMDFSFTEESDGLLLTFTFNTDIYEEAQMNELIGRFEQLVLALEASPSSTLLDIDLLKEEEQDKIINSFGKNPFAGPEGETLISLFEKQVNKTPEDIALVFAEEEWTYQALDERANQLARHLRQAGVQQEELVAICIERSPQMIMGLLGIMKAGGAYVPIDASYPSSRIDHILKDSAAKVVLSSDQCKAVLASHETLEIVNLSDWTAIGKQSGDPLDFGPTPDHLAYLIYTSGSTGYPKGVEIEHASIVNEITYLFQFFGLGEKERILQTGNFVFDLSIEQIFSSLLHGGTLVLISEQDLLDNHALETILEKQKITHLHATPSFLQTLTAKDYPALKVVISGGEACSVDVAKAWSKHNRFYNMYGPTEASIISTGYLFNEAPNPEDLQRIPIGRPVGNFEIYVVDQGFKPVPVGVVGELYIGGKGLARGYRNQPELTAEKFISSPFKTGERLYRTGDLVRWLPEGNLEFHGRIDNQVKINGQRIEVGGVESRIRQLELIKDVVVIIDEDQNQKKYLCGFVLPEKEVKISVAELRTQLKEDIPGYMIPRLLKIVDHIPMTSSGKADKRALASLIESNESMATVPYEAPQTEVEQLLVQAWEDILKRSGISILENFYDIGGDSISAIQIASFLYKSGYKVDIKDIMQYATIKELATHVHVLKRIADQGLVTGYHPLTPIQKSFFEQRLSAQQHFNQDMVISSSDRFDEEALRKSLQKIQEHHDVLRTRFDFSGSSISAFVEDLDRAVVLEVHDLRTTQSAKEKMAEIATEIHASMDLETGPLMKSVLFRLPDSDDLLIAIHHLLIDEVSWRIFLEDFNAFYEAFHKGQAPKLPLKTDAYKYWSEKLSEYAYSDSFKTDARFWDKVAKIPVQRIPYDSDRVGEASMVKNYKNAHIELTKETTAQLLTEANQAFNTKINDLLLTAFGQATQEVFSVEAVCVSMESHGRVDLSNNMNIERTMGWFTCEYPVYLDLNHKNDLAKQIKTIKEHLHQIPNNGISYGVRKYLLEEKMEEPTAKPQMVFNYLGQVEDKQEENGQQASLQYYNGLGQTESLENQAKYPIEITAVAQNGKLQIIFSYDSLKLKTSTVENWIENYQTKLIELAEYCCQKEGKELTPSDFDYKDLSIDDLEELEALFG